MSGRPCDLCQAYEFNKFGRPVKDKATGKWERRQMPHKVPCKTPVGCPKGTPAEQKDLTPENRRAYEHYQECKATGQFPDDPLVRRNASIIMQAEKEADQDQQVDLTALQVLSVVRTRARGSD